MSGIPVSPQGPAGAAVAGWAPFALGFRPFFLLAGVSSVGLMLLWLGLWHTGFAAEAYYGRIPWHAHEMLFGYGGAVIAGFLLTAVGNWTGQQTLSGPGLAALAMVWLLGRLLPWVPGIPPLLISITDLAFLPLLAIALVRPIWRGTNRVNRVFPCLLMAMAVANLLVHLQAFELTSASSGTGITLMLDLVLVLITLVGGRVLPFFTKNAVAGSKPRLLPWVDTASFAALGALILVHLAGDWVVLGGYISLLVAVLQGIRLAGWWNGGAGMRKQPLLWVLHSGYAWLVIGFFLQGLAALHLIPASSALHALTAGAVGVFTIGMMARVALGHSGRPLQPSARMVVAFWLINIAAVLRVFGPMFVPAWYLSWIVLAGLLWVASFLIFAVLYTPILLRTRVDGRPG